MDTSFHTRLRQLLGKWTIKQYRNFASAPADLNQEIKALAVEAILSSQKLIPELDWLFSEEAEHAAQFTECVGELDSQHLFWTEFQRRAMSSMYPVASYLQGHVDAGRIEWRDQILDMWMSQGEEEANAVFQTIGYRIVSDRDAVHLTKLVQEGKLTPQRLGELEWGSQTKVLSTSAFRDLVAVMLEQASTEAVSLLKQRLEFFPNESVELSSASWYALEHCQGLFENRTTAYHWNILAQNYLQRDSLRIARSILFHMEHTARSSDTLDETNTIMQLLGSATKQSPISVWEEVGQVLLHTDRKSLTLLNGLKGWYTENIPSKILISWARKHLPEGPRLLAKLAPMGETPLNRLARDLVIRYGSDQQVVSNLFSALPKEMEIGTVFDWYQLQLDRAREWKKDPHPAVRRWVESHIRQLEQQLDQERHREREDVR